MIKERRGGPSRPLVAGRLAITNRVRRLVDDVHGGNLLEASAYAGVPYRTLREIHAGRGRIPGHATLERLALAYELPIDWFTSGGDVDDGTIPVAGWIGFLPDDPRPARRVAVPVGAWPLIRVLAQLEQRLTSLPPSVGRPIIGLATDPREIRRRLTAFIFQPILAARVARTRSDSPVGPPASPPRLPPARNSDEWSDMLRDLGRFWERALHDLM